MFLRSTTTRNKDGKQHRYYSVVENGRLTLGKVAQRTVRDLGEINNSQESAWRKSLDVFDEDIKGPTTLCLFPEDREHPANALDAVQVKISAMELRRPRAFGNCWLACELWQQLGLAGFWEERLPQGRDEVPWMKVLQLLVVNQLVDPGSEFWLHRQWFEGIGILPFLRGSCLFRSRGASRPASDKMHYVTSGYPALPVCL